MSESDQQPTAETPWFLDPDLDETGAKVVARARLQAAIAHWEESLDLVSNAHHDLASAPSDEAASIDEQLRQLLTRESALYVIRNLVADLLHSGAVLDALGVRHGLRPQLMQQARQFAANEINVTDNSVDDDSEYGYFTPKGSQGGLRGALSPVYEFDNIADWESQDQTRGGDSEVVPDLLFRIADRQRALQAIRSYNQPHQRSSFESRSPVDDLSEQIRNDSPDVAEALNAVYRSVQLVHDIAQDSYFHSVGRVVARSTSDFRVEGVDEIRIGYEYVQLLLRPAMANALYQSIQPQPRFDENDAAAMLEANREVLEFADRFGIALLTSAERHNQRVGDRILPRYWMDHQALNGLTGDEVAAPSRPAHQAPAYADHQQRRLAEAHGIRQRTEDNLPIRIISDDAGPTLGEIGAQLVTTYNQARLGEQAAVRAQAKSQAEMYRAIALDAAQVAARVHLLQAAVEGPGREAPLGELREMLELADVQISNRTTVDRSHSLFPSGVYDPALVHMGPIDTRGLPHDLGAIGTAVDLIAAPLEETAEQWRRWPTELQWARRPFADSATQAAVDDELASAWTRHLVQGELSPGEFHKLRERHVNALTPGVSGLRAELRRTVIDVQEFVLNRALVEIGTRIHTDFGAAENPNTVPRWLRALQAYSMIIEARKPEHADALRALRSASSDVPLDVIEQTIGDIGRAIEVATPTGTPARVELPSITARHDELDPRRIALDRARRAVKAPSPAQQVAALDVRRQLQRRSIDFLPARTKDGREVIVVPQREIAPLAWFLAATSPITGSRAHDQVQHGRSLTQATDDNEMEYRRDGEQLIPILRRFDLRDGEATSAVFVLPLENRRYGMAADSFVPDVNTPGLDLVFGEGDVSDETLSEVSADDRRTAPVDMLPTIEAPFGEIAASTADDHVFLDHAAGFLESIIAAGHSSSSAKETLFRVGDLSPQVNGGPELPRVGISRTFADVTPRLVPLAAHFRSRWHEVTAGMDEAPGDNLATAGRALTLSPEYERHLAAHLGLEAIDELREHARPFVGQRIFATSTVPVDTGRFEHHDPLDDLAQVAGRVLTEAGSVRNTERNVMETLSRHGVRTPEAQRAALIGIELVAVREARLSIEDKMLTEPKSLETLAKALAADSDLVIAMGRDVHTHRSLVNAGSIDPEVFPEGDIIRAIPVARPDEGPGRGSGAEPIPDPDDVLGPDNPSVPKPREPDSPRIGDKRIHGEPKDTGADVPDQPGPEDSTHHSVESVSTSDATQPDSAPRAESPPPETTRADRAPTQQPPAHDDGSGHVTDTTTPPSRDRSQPQRRAPRARPARPGPGDTTPTRDTEPRTRTSRPAPRARPVAPGDDCASTARPEPGADRDDAGTPQPAEDAGSNRPQRVTPPTARPPSPDGKTTPSPKPGRSGPAHGPGLGGQGL